MIVRLYLYNFIFYKTILSGGLCPLSSVWIFIITFSPISILASTVAEPIWGNNTVLGASREGYSAWYCAPVLDYCTKYLVPAVQKDTWNIVLHGVDPISGGRAVKPAWKYFACSTKLWPSGLQNTMFELGVTHSFLEKNSRLVPEILIWAIIA